MCLWIQVHTASKTERKDAQANSHLNVVLYDTTMDGLDDVEATPAELPFFEDSSSYVNITVQMGANVVLQCKVNDLSDKTTVSWLRRHDGKLRLLSVGMEVYSTDGRYSTIFRRPNDWQLHVKNANERDEGHYECQVSSHPPIVYTVYLHIVVPELEIADERGIAIRNKFYNSGSTIELKCIITKVPQPTQFIMWRHGERILNYDTVRGGISVKTDILQNGAKSRLFIANANAQDSGNYTCSLAEVAATSVYIHVLNAGETPAAMQHGDCSRVVHTTWSILLFVFLLCCTSNR